VEVNPLILLANYNLLILIESKRELMKQEIKTAVLKKLHIDGRNFSSLGKHQSLMIKQNSNKSKSLGNQTKLLESASNN
jgi:hypothetical protein